jgi:lipoic acid synthetase
MIMGDICTRRCPFCDVGHGRPKPLDVNEPESLAIAIADLRLKYVVITSVDRDDLRDGGAQHFADCIREIRKLSPNVQLETLVPDYRGRMDIALEITAPSRRMCSTTTWKPCRACTRPRVRVRTTSGR